MTELSGTLEGVGLPAIIRFLGGLKKSGSLRIAEHGWQGEIFFDEGQVRDARLGSRSGLAVVDALVETMPGASFAFDSQAQFTREPSIRLSPDAFQAHLDELSGRVAREAFNLPRPDAVPVHRTEEEADGEPLSLDRGTLQTLLAIDGKRTVGEIVAQRGSFEALWQIGSLIEANLVELRTTSAARTPAIEAPRPAVTERVGQPQVVAEPAPLPPAIESPALERLAQCPKLGFEDDADSSFDRPTRLHRCFAAGTPMPLSLDQQRELCLSDHFGSCPRLTPLVPAVPEEQASPRSSRPNRQSPRARPTPTTAEPDDSRILRIPFGSRGAAQARETGATPPSEPTRLRAAAAAAATETSAERPRPLRARMERAVSAQAPAIAPRVASPASSNAGEAVAASSAMLEPQAPASVEVPAAHLQARAAAQAQVGALAERRPPVRRIGVIAGALVVLAIVGAGAVSYSGQLVGLFGDDSVDPASLPNTSRVAAGTPVSALPVSRATPAAASNHSAAALAATLAAAQPTAVAQPTGADPAAQADPSAQPTPLSGPTPSAAAASTSARVLLDEPFTTNSANWPSSPRGASVLTNGSYHIATQKAGQFVAIGAPITNLPADVVVSATFHKLAGPAGGGYGIIVRDQATGPRDGSSQDGRYYVLEVGDKGEVGMWRRESDHWVDLMTWQPSAAVKPDAASNELTVRAIGNTLSLAVNGTQVATRTDNSFASGGVGLFVGGDGNQVAVDHFTIQTP